MIFKKLEETNIKTKKKIKIYLGINLKNEYCLIAVWPKKVFLPEDFIFLKEIESKIPINFRYKKKILLLNCEVSQNMKEQMKSWRIFGDFG